MNRFFKLYSCNKHNFMRKIIKFHSAIELTNRLLTFCPTSAFWNVWNEKNGTTGNAAICVKMRQLLAYEGHVLWLVITEHRLITFWVCLMKIYRPIAQGNKALCNIVRNNASLICYVIKIAGFAVYIAGNFFYFWRHQCGMFPTPPKLVANVVGGCTRVCKQSLISKNTFCFTSGWNIYARF